MDFTVNRVVELEDFKEPIVRDTIREVFAQDAEKTPEFPEGQEHRKQWEVAMAVLALRGGGVLRPDAEVLGIGAGVEATLFWLTNHVARVFATDLYADSREWGNAAPPTMLTDPRSAWSGPWNPRRLVVQHMDACDLAYEDETFDGIFSSGSIEHFGGLERIGIAMDESFRVLKPGGTASFSTEFLIDGDPLAYESHMVLFTPELIERVLIGDRDWSPTTPPNYTVTKATLATDILTSEEYAARQERGESVCPHCVVRAGSNRFTSVHISLRKSPSPRPLPARPRSNAPRTAVVQAAAGAAATPSTRPAPKHSSNGVGTLPNVANQRHGSTLKQVARKFARPVLSPIDGRVGDINRRVAHHAATLERSLDAYGRSSSEASSYVGVELRRLQDQLAALHEQQAGDREQVAALQQQVAGLQRLVAGFAERSLEEYYQMRIAQVPDLPLEKLDASLAQALNSILDHRGFYGQAGLWFNPPVSVALTAGGAVAANVSERIVETPFAMAALSRVERGARILDVGSAESTFPLSAASLGYKVTAIDPRPLAYSHPNLESHETLLEDWEAPSDPFAAAFLISTIEHAGLGAYGERRYGSSEHGAGADLALLDHVRELLSPDGLVILTTPYGTRELTDLERVYDEESLDKLLAGWEVLDRQIVVRRNRLIWEPDEKVVTAARGVVMLVASPKKSG